MIQYVTFQLWVQGQTIIKMCCYVLRSTRPPEGSQRSRAQPLTPRWRTGGPYHVTTKFYFYPMISNLQNSINIYPWFWRRLTSWYSIVTHSSGAWHNGLFLTKASNIKCWADVANHGAWLWQTDYMENFEHRNTGYLWPYGGLELINHGTISLYNNTELRITTTQHIFLIQCFHGLQSHTITTPSKGMIEPG